MPDQEGEVRAEALLLDPFEVLAERRQRATSSFGSKLEGDESRPASVIGASVSPQLPDNWVV